MPLISPSDWIVYMLLGGVMGCLGQIVRAVAGLKKVNDERPEGVAFSQVFEWPRFVVSLILGFTAGALAVLTVDAPESITAKFLIALMAAGYGAADFIEAFVKQRLPARFTSPPAPQAHPVESLQPGASSSAHLLAAAPAARALSIENAVITVIAREKNVDPKEIKLGDKLSVWHFDLADRRSLANAINIYFYDDLHMVFDTWLHPVDTEQDQTVSQVAQKVRSRHPRPRTDAAPPTS